MDQANRRLELLASHLSGVEDEGLARNPTSAVPARDSATVALPEKLCDDPHWRVHRCFTTLSGLLSSRKTHVLSPDTLVNSVPKARACKQTNHISLQVHGESQGAGDNV